MRTLLRFLLVGAIGLGTFTPAAGAAGLTVTFTTTPNGGNYAPKNVVAAWIEGPGGTFVKTIGRWAATRKGSLVAWTGKAGAADADAVSGATRASHAAPLTANWNLLDKAGALVPDGTYTIRFELADSNANAAGQNHQGTFTFVKGPAPQTQNALTNGGFTNVTITFDPIVVPATCNNGALDANEKCDPALAGSCPATCAASADACMPNNLVGSAVTCTAECVVQPITACADGDGCCPAGCDGMDTDCTGGGGGGGGGSTDPTIEGGCAAGGSSSGELFAFGILGALALGARRRRA